MARKQAFLAALLLSGLFALALPLLGKWAVFLSSGNVVSIDKPTVGELAGKTLVVYRSLFAPDIPAPAAYGDTLLILDGTHIIEGTQIKAGLYPVTKRYDLSDIAPMKVQSGDVNGDGAADISLCVYKKTPLHPVYAKRAFFYTYGNGALTALFKASRMARPFEDYVLADLNGDGRDEVVSVETDRDGRMLLHAYSWDQFGFVGCAESKRFDKISELTAEGNTVAAKTEAFEDEQQTSRSLCFAFDDNTETLVESPWVFFHKIDGEKE